MNIYLTRFLFPALKKKNLSVPNFCSMIYCLNHIMLMASMNFGVVYVKVTHLLILLLVWKMHAICIVLIFVTSSLLNGTMWWVSCIVPVHSHSELKFETCKKEENTMNSNQGRTMHHMINNDYQQQNYLTVINLFKKATI